MEKQVPDNFHQKSEFGFVPSPSAILISSDSLANYIDIGAEGSHFSLKYHLG